MYKRQHFEGGMHIPFMARWPKEIAAGTNFSPVVHHNDIFKTIAAAAKAELPKDRKLDGFNFLPFVKGEKNGEIHQTIFWRQGHQQTVYHKGWKLIRTNDENQKWLFNLNEDPTEKNNLIKYLKKKFKRSEIFFLMGADNLINFHKWKGYNSITKMCKILVFDRNGYKSKAFRSKSFKKYNKKAVEFIKFNKVNISSSQLRKI